MANSIQSCLNVNNIAKELFVAPGYLQDGDVVEFTGDPATGKSALLQHLMITCLLPKSYGGCNSGVIYFDLDCHLDLLRILSVIEQRTGANEADIKLWLKNLYVLRCDSMAQLAITLHSIEPLIANSRVPFGMIILDSISSFYWIDAQSGGENQYLKEANLRKVVQVLKLLKDRYRLCILASTQQLVHTEARQPCVNSTNLLHKPFLCHYWQDFVKHKYALTTEGKSEETRSLVRKAHCLTSKSQFVRTFLINEAGVSFINCPSVE